MWDSKDRKYLDMLAGYGAFNMGRNHPDIRQVLKDFMDADFIELRRPRRDMDPAGVSERHRANQNWADILYQGASQKRNY